ncbi:MAG: hypothetical protein KDB04_18495 [Acidimicrobiales bacterium]|nr:hypothetical protein [Acidimicrobiales bacterium]HRW36760.1 hypothetical protein [Aquihabitans sp.]
MATRTLTRQQLLDLDGFGLAVELDRQDRRQLAAAVSTPAMTLRVHVEMPDLKAILDGWVGRDLVVLHPEGGPNEPLPASFADPAFLPSLLADAVGFGVRADATGAQALVERVELATALRDGASIESFGPVAVVWTVQWFPAGGAPGGLTVVDGGPGAPIWTARSTAEDRLVLEDRGSLEVWARLGALRSIAATTAGDEATAEERADTADVVG